jgi:hypothetical protein
MHLLVFTHILTKCTVQEAKKKPQKFISSALEGNNSQTHVPAVLPHRKDTYTDSMGGSIEPRTCLDILEKVKIPALLGLELLPFRLFPKHYDALIL